MPTPLEQYLEVYDDGAGAVFVQIDAAIRAAAPELETAIKYRLLSYTVERDWRHGPLQGPAASLRVSGGRGSFYCSTIRSACSARAPRR